MKASPSVSGCRSIFREHHISIANYSFPYLSVHNVHNVLYGKVINVIFFVWKLSSNDGLILGLRMILILLFKLDLTFLLFFKIFIVYG